jgi:hypothetical protein
MGKDANEFGMDPEIQTKKLEAGPLPIQLRQLRLSWFWAGWLSDQGLFKTAPEDKTRLGMWLSQSLSQDGPYPIHNIFFNARRQAVISNDIEAWGDALVKRRRIWDFAGLRSFAYQTNDLPTEQSYRAMTVHFTSNCFRMNLLLLEDEITQYHSVWIKASTKANVKVMVSFIKNYEPEGAPSAEAMGQRLASLIESARERNQFHPER